MGHAIDGALSGLVVFLSTSFACFRVIHRVKRVTKIVRPFVAENISVSHAPEQIKDLQSTCKPVAASLLNLDCVIRVLRHDNRLLDGLGSVERSKLEFRY